MRPGCAILLHSLCWLWEGVVARMKVRMLRQSSAVGVLRPGSRSGVGAQRYEWPRDGRGRVSLGLRVGERRDVDA